MNVLWVRTVSSFDLYHELAAISSLHDLLVHVHVHVHVGCDGRPCLLDTAFLYMYSTLYTAGSFGFSGH